MIECIDLPTAKKRNSSYHTWVKNGANYTLDKIGQNFLCCTYEKAGVIDGIGYAVTRKVQIPVSQIELVKEGDIVKIEDKTYKLTNIVLRDYNIGFNPFYEAEIKENNLQL